MIDLSLLEDYDFGNSNVESNSAEQIRVLEKQIDDLNNQIVSLRDQIYSLEMRDKRINLLSRYKLGQTVTFDREYYDVRGHSTEFSFLTGVIVGIKKSYSQGLTFEVKVPYYEGTFEFPDYAIVNREIKKS